MRAVIRRGVFHIGCGMVIALSGLFLPRNVVLITLGVAALLLLALELARFAIPSVNRWFLKVFRPFIREEETARATGALYMLISSFLAYMAFEIHIAMLAIAFLVAIRLFGILRSILATRWTPFHVSSSTRIASVGTGSPPTRRFPTVQTM